MPDFSGWTGYQTMDGNTNCRAWADWQTTRVFRNGQAGWDVRIILKANKTTSLPTYGTGNTQVGAHQTNSSVDTKYMTIVQSETTFRDETLFVPAEAGADIPLAAYANIHIPNVVSKGIKFTVTAKRNLWGVYFDANGGSGAPSMMKRHWGEVVYIPTSFPTRSGYTFKGWTKEQGSSTIGYSPGDPIGDDADVTLYAVWSQNVTKTWSIIYNANGGYNTPEKQTANVGQSITVTSSKPTRNGYTFLGWSTWSEATEPEIAFTPGYSYKSDYNFTLYAVWKEKGKPKFTFSKSYDCIPYGIGAVEELVMNATVENPENLKIYYKICFVDDADGTVNDYATNSNGLTNMIETGIASANLTVQPDILIQSIKNCNNEQSFKIVICSNYDNNFDISNTAINKEIVSIRLYYNKPVIQSLDVSHAPHNSAQLVGVVKLSDNFINTSFRGNGESVYIDNKLMELGEDYGDDNRFDVDGVNTLRYVFNFNVNKISDVSHIFKLAVDDGFFKTEQTVNLGRLSSDENIYIYQDGTIEANGFLLLDSLNNEDVILFEPGGFVSAKSFEKISDGICFCPKVLEAFGHTQRTGN
ncbi:hypothetical protein DWZ70_14930 [Mediterraneibacter gnavus]|uniref:InlB B-repeat-containing protein n=1 Tax=Mediterraneibacter gnavus TaxID=33038 RepID=UPI000E47D115|nr:InlB B-repeat-containing protein [Mediterraneibacter gnavus]RHM34068.1 hypothetical protein DWZ70_14930 [Mediterraneibacter gnavus]